VPTREVYTINGLSLPFERLYFEARRQLFSATKKLLEYRLKEYAANRDRDEIWRFGPPRTGR
jgi:hypothetical protein